MANARMHARVSPTTRRAAVEKARSVARRNERGRKNATTGPEHYGEGRAFACLPLRARFFVENCRNGYRTQGGTSTIVAKEIRSCADFLATDLFFLFFSFSFFLLFGTVF